MKQFLKSKKGLILLATLVVAAAAAVGAYAYFTATGSGTGTASVGTSTDWTIEQAGSTGPDLLPDATIGTGNIQTESYQITNPGAGQQNLAQVDIYVSATGVEGSWSAQADTGKPACTADDFSVGGAAVGATYTDTDSAGNFAPGELRSDSVTVQLIDNGLNQDNCKNLDVPLWFAAS